jgi:DNA-binding transcriptional regulator YiaG
MNEEEICIAAVLDAANAELERSNLAPLVMVSAVVRASKLPTERAHAALIEAARRGQLELRPESGMDRLSKADAALCLPGPQGSVLSVLRVVGAEATKPEAELDADALRKRIERALKASRFESAAELAREADVGQNDVSRIRKGFGLVQDKLARLDTALSARGA